MMRHGRFLPSSFATAWRCASLLAGLALAGCAQPAARPLLSPTSTASRHEAAAAAVTEWLLTFPQSYRRWLAAEAPVPQALAQTLADPGLPLEQRPVLRLVYTSPTAALRFVGAGELTESGRVLREALSRAPEHGLEPRRLHLEAIERLLQQLRLQDQAQHRRKAPTGLLPEQRQQLIARLKQTPSPDLRQALKEILLGTTSPAPEIKRLFLTERRQQLELVQTVSQLELYLADGLLQLARQLSRGNTAPAELTIDWKLQDLERAGRAAGAPPASQASAEPPASAQEAKQARHQALLAQVALPGPLALLARQGPESYVQALLAHDLRQAGEVRALQALLADLPPRHPQYARLLALRQRYLKLVASGPWPAVPSRGYRPGRTSPAAAALKQRLAVEGFYEGEADSRFDQALIQAISRYQQAHQLPVSGRVDRLLLEQLAVSAADKLQQIELNLQRWRRAPIGRVSYYVLINVPGFFLEIYRDSQRGHRQQVIVGRADVKRCDEQTESKVLAHATPVQSGLIRTLVFSPYWNVPAEIKQRELDPERAKDPLYYERHGYQIMHPGSYGEWVRQLPGPQNPLGFVKFLFPNPHETYLHGTPEGRLFRQPLRAYSHGCIRLEDPLALARVLLEADGGWDEERFRELQRRWQQLDATPLRAEGWDPDLYDRLLEQAKQLVSELELQRPVPVHVLYRTVWVDEAGLPRFYRDLYGEDAAQLSPAPAARCVPESKRARWAFRRLPERVAQLEQEAQALAPELARALLVVLALNPQSSWQNRRLRKQAAKLGGFVEQHRNLAQSALDSHLTLSQLLKRRGSWQEPLLERAVRLYHLLQALEQLTASARSLCRSATVQAAPTP